jgi:hypothetical protein
LNFIPKLITFALERNGGFTFTEESFNQAMATNAGSLSG